MNFVVLLGMVSDKKPCQPNCIPVSGGRGYHVTAFNFMVDISSVEAMIMISTMHWHLFDKMCTVLIGCGSGVRNSPLSTY